MISKELLSEVLSEDYEILKISQHFVRVRHLEAYYSCEWCIYLVAHKCKEWAFKNGYELRSGRDIDVKEDICYFCEYKQERQLDYRNGDYFLAGTEVEAIFKACQWILDNKED